MKKSSLFIIATCSIGFAKVDPPNYNFSIETLEKIMPGSELAQIQKEFGKGEVVKKDAGQIVTKIYIAQLRFKFPVFIQSREGKVLDFYARLPDYFLHDVFHQSLINKHGKQNFYQRRPKEEYAIYRWSKPTVELVYEGACAITCYPVYFAASIPKKEWVGEYKPYYEKLEMKLNQKR